MVQAPQTLGCGEEIVRVAACLYESSEDLKGSGECMLG